MKNKSTKTKYLRHSGKVGPSPWTLRTSGTHWDHPLRPRDPFQPLGPLGTPRTFWEHWYFLECDAWKGFLGHKNKYFMFKKLQFFNCKNFSIPNRLLLGNNLLEIFNSLLKLIKYSLIHSS